MEHPPELSPTHTTTTFAELVDDLTSPESLQLGLQTLARRIHRETKNDLYGYTPELTSGYDSDEGTEVLTDDIFEQLFDANRPTLLVDHLRALAGNSLLGMAAQESDTVNVVYVSGGLPCLAAAEHNGQSVLYATHGVLLDSDGIAYHGKLPTPTPISMVESVDLDILRQCRDMGIATAINPDLHGTTNNKHLLPSLYEHTDVPTIPAISPQDLPDHQGQIIIKPGIGSHGRGVRFFDAQSPDALRYFDFLATNGYDPLIQPRIHSYPLVNPHTQERLDWNVRAIVADGALIDMYVRAHSWGAVVNKATGAQALELSQLADYGLSAEQLETITQNIITATLEIGEATDSSLAGLDLIVDEHMQARLLEVNIGILGGMQSIAAMRPNVEKLAGSHALLEQWHSRMAMPLAPAVETAVTPLALTSGSIFTHNMLLRSDYEPIERLSPTEVAAIAQDVAYISIWAVSGLAKAPNAVENAKKIISTYPLSALPEAILMPLNVTLDEGFRNFFRLLCEEVADMGPYYTLQASHAAAMGNLTTAKRYTTKLPAHRYEQAVRMSSIYYAARHDMSPIDIQPHLTHYFEHGLESTLKVIDTQRTKDPYQAELLHFLGISLAFGEQHYVAAADRILRHSRIYPETHGKRCNQLRMSFGHQRDEPLAGFILAHLRVTPDAETAPQQSRLQKLLSKIVKRAP
jgi:glutathione synthase/RimK-type ligase-like ATP-grasp enzyme